MFFGDFEDCFLLRRLVRKRLKGPISAVKNLGCLSNAHQVFVISPLRISSVASSLSRLHTSFCEKPYSISLATARSKRPVHLDVMACFFTLYVDNLPNSTGLPWFRKFFSNFGFVVNVHLPVRRSKRTGNRFGFVRFKNSRDTQIAIAKTDGFWIGRRNLIVERARFDRGGNSKDFSQPTAYNIPTKAYNAKVWPHNHQNCPKETRGKEVWRRKGVVESSKQGALTNTPLRNLGTIYAQTAGCGWLTRSAVAMIRRPISTEDLATIFKREGISDIQIKAMGGRFVLIIFSDKETRDSTISQKWLLNWVEEIKQWNGEHASVERFAWISCFGMPLNAWSCQAFKDIGGCFGQFIQMDESTLKEKSFEKGRVLVATEQFQKISGTVDIIIQGEKFVVRVEEDESFRTFKHNSSSAFLERLMENEGVAEEGPGVEEKKDLEPINECKYDSKVADVPDAQLNISTDSNFSSSGIGSSTRVIEKVPDSYAERLETQGQGGNALIDVVTISEEHALIDTGFNKRNNDVDIQDVFSANEALNEVCEPNQNEVAEVCPHEDFFEKNNTSIQAAVKGVQGKRRRKTIDEILGNSKVNKLNQKVGRGKKKCVVLRSAIAAAALSASVSSEGITNRNKFILSEAQTIRQMNKLIGYKYDGEDEEVISKIAELEKLEKEAAEAKLN